ncbi:MAG TPA: TetR/AcrR family transcriptional regulator [Ohtaekwangia sp.]|uniref:TetR/AcrR family transcriptional regulator n=1 Tax=Ohtaekwangia sp. TaxID=2066019 RepID=UPI002F92F773
MKKGERTRRLILERTANLFNSRGYSQTSLADIMDATGLSKGTIYSNFEDKAHLAIAAFEYNLERLNGRVNAEMDQCATIREKMVVYIRVYSVFLQQTLPNRSCPVLNAMSKVDNSVPVLKQKLKWAVMGWKNKLVALLEKGIHAREFHSSINCEQIAAAFIVLLEGAVMLNKTLEDVKTAQLIIGYVEKMIVGIPSGEGEERLEGPFLKI